MRYARWMRDGRTHDGVVVAHEGGDRLLAFADGLTVLGATRLGLERANAVAASLIEAARADGSLGLAPTVSDVELMAPIEAPSVRDFVAFEEHVEGVVKSIDGDSGVVAEWYDAPTFYFTNPHSLVGSGASIRPPVTERLDFELEVAVIVGGVDGSDGSNLDEAAAADHIFGYSVFNDWSARDIQSREMKVRLGPCKGKDFAATLGPWIVTADELADAHDADGFLELELRVLVNGELIGSDLLSNMGWSFPHLLVYASRNSRVVPGDVLGSGTAGNGGCLAELWGRAGSLTPPPLAEGDVVELRVERIGEISNVIGAAVEAVPVPRARAPRPQGIAGPNERTRERMSGTDFGTDSGTGWKNPGAAGDFTAPGSNAGAVPSAAAESAGRAPIHAGEGERQLVDEQVTPAGEVPGAPRSHLDDVVIVAAARTPQGKLNGQLSTLTAPQLGAAAISGALAQGSIDASLVDAVLVGHVLSAGVGQNAGRQAALAAGIPASAHVATINKVCLSGLTAVIDAARLLKTGDAQLVVAAGMESMSQAPHLLAGSRKGWAYGSVEALDHMAHDGLTDAASGQSMGLLTEQHNTSLGITREAQDAVAARSHQRAAAAVDAGLFDAEIVAVDVPVRRGAPVRVTRDEGIRPSTTTESLAGLRAAFAADGTITAGNASPISDGASAVVLTTRAFADAHGYDVLAVVGAAGQVAGPDASLQSQPSRAIARACEKQGIEVSSLDHVEINEAFAAVVVQSQTELGVSDEVVNPHGGAIALGHPIGASGARVVVHAVHELNRRGGGTAAVALCGGGGQGDALILTR